jgi:transposase-like protein
MGRRSDAALHRAWRRRWERFSRSSVTVAEFCRREGVSQAAFYHWRKRLTREGTSAEKQRATDASAGQRTGVRPSGHRGAFVEVAVVPVAVVELELPNGVRVRVPADRGAAVRAAIRAAGELASLPTAPTEEAPAC